MKNLFLPLLLGLSFFLLCSCNIRTQREKVDTDTIKIDSVAIDSINREKKFAVRGDTVFANLLYGMNKQEVTQRLIEFEKKLKHPDPRMEGYVFANIHFMNISITDFENNPFLTIDKYPIAIMFKNKLGSVTWHSYHLYANSKWEIERLLNDFILFFENKYGKPNFKKHTPSNWVVYYQGKWFYCDITIALWETSNRKIYIDLEWDSPRAFTATNSSISDYKYHLNVVFLNKTIMEEMETYKNLKTEEKNNAEEERARQDSIKSMNLL